MFYRDGCDEIMRCFALIMREFRLHSVEYANPDLITSENAGLQ